MASRYRAVKDVGAWIVVRWDGRDEAPALCLDAERRNPKTLWSFLRNPDAKPGFAILRMCLRLKS